MHLTETLAVSLFLPLCVVVIGQVLGHKLNRDQYELTKEMRDVLKKIEENQPKG